MSLTSQFRKATHREVLEANNRKLMHKLASVAAVLAEYANGSNWTYKGEYKNERFIWIGEGNPEELAKLALKQTFGPDALSQIAKKVVRDG